MQPEDPRIDAAAAIRDLIHTFVARDPDDDQLRRTSTDVQAITEQLAATPRRDRLARMQAALGTDSFPLTNSASGFADRAVGGGANPTGIEMLDVDMNGADDDIVARVVLRQGFEGAPGRAHGGIVAAAFDDITGFVIGRMREPAFTGELTVRYLAPVPVEEELEIRTRLESRERRKLFITADARHHDTVIATCRAIYITVDPTRFAGFPDPR
jgi:acyl-coenzyme A thioesterase PaaI-like protein